MSVVKSKILVLKGCLCCEGPHLCFELRTYPMCLRHESKHAVAACNDLHRVCNISCLQGHCLEHLGCLERLGETWAEVVECFDPFADWSYTPKIAFWILTDMFHFGVGHFWRSFSDGRIPYAYVDLVRLPVGDVQAWILGHRETPN